MNKLSFLLLRLQNLELLDNRYEPTVPDMPHQSNCLFEHCLLEAEEIVNVKSHAW